MLRGLFSLHHGSEPLLDRDNTDGFRRVCAPSAAGGSAFVIRVLVVGVDNLQQASLAKMFSKLSCQAYFTSTKDAAIGLILQNAYHVVIVNEECGTSVSAIIMAARTSPHCKRAAVALLRQSGSSEQLSGDAAGTVEKGAIPSGDDAGVASGALSRNDRSDRASKPRYWPEERGTCERRRGRRADFLLTSPVTMTQLTNLFLNCNGFLQYYDSIHRNLLDAELSLEGEEERFLSSLPDSKLEPGVTRRLKVLVVDDSPINRRSISQMLSRMDCEIEQAGDGEEAVRRVRDDEVPYSFVMMDVQMARMDGCQATRLIRRLPDTIRAMVPIAAITSHTNSHKRCYDAGMDIMLPKPVKFESVKKILRTTVTNFSERVAINVLVVDDNVVVLRQISMLFEQLGCKVTTAANGFEAMKIVAPESEIGNAEAKVTPGDGDGGGGNGGTCCV